MIKKFFHDIFPERNLYRLIWTLDGKKSYWFQNNIKMIEFVSQYERDIYYGVGMAATTPENNPEHHRLTNKTVTAIKTLHLDIDIKSKVAHKSDNLPETIDEARQIAMKFADPTWLINTGHGLHAFYVLDELFEIKSENDCKYFTLISQKWQEIHRQAFPQYDIDATFDVARVLRCPGSMNCKDPENKVKAEIVEYNDDSYFWIEELEDIINDNYKEPELAIPGKSSKTFKSSKEPITNTATWTTKDFNDWFDGNGLVVNPKTKIDNDIWLELDSFDPKFSDTFHQRLVDDNNKKIVDINSYDLRLANIAAKLNLPDQTIVDLMVYHRIYNDKKTEKACHARRDYYARTLIKASVHKALEKIDSKKKKGKKIDQIDRQAILSYLNDKLSCQILRYIKLERDPDPLFELEIAEQPGKTIKLGTFEKGVMNQRTFRAKIGATGARMPQPVDKSTWESDIVKKLQDIMEDATVPDTATYEGRIETWIQDYFAHTTVYGTAEEYFENKNYDEPFFHDDRVHFKIEALQEWVKTNKGEVLDFSFVTTMISTGFTQKKIKDGGLPIRLWVAPQGFYKVEE